MWKAIRQTGIRALARVLQRLRGPRGPAVSTRSKEERGQATRARIASRASFWAELREGQREAEARTLKGEQHS